MKFTDEEIGNFINCYNCNIDREFSGKIDVIGELKYGERKAGTDYFVDETQRFLAGKKIVCVWSDAEGSLEMMLLDNFGYFYEYRQNKSGYKLTQIVPSVADFLG